jgi:hypothetical protein
MTLSEVTEIPKASIEITKEAVPKVSKPSPKPKEILISSPRPFPKLLMPKDAIQEGKHLGAGGYGDVKLGYLMGEPVAIKMVMAGLKQYFDTEIQILR